MYSDVLPQCTHPHIEEPVITGADELSRDWLQVDILYGDGQCPHTQDNEEDGDQQQLPLHHLQPVIAGRVSSAN